MNNILFAFLLTLIAGLSTGIGSLVALFSKRSSFRFLSMALGFSAGVMLYISMVELYHESFVMLTASLGADQGYWFAVLGFFTGICLIAIIDSLVPDFENPHAVHLVEEMKTKNVVRCQQLMRVGFMTAFAISLHNFPEGIATFFSAIKSPSLGVATTLAIALHNIPEGIAIAVPVYFATNSRRKAFRWSFLSGLSEPLGAVLGYLLLKPYLNDTLLGLIFSAVAGIMVYISLDVLLPAAREYENAHLSIYGTILGMLVMAVSLYLF